MGDESSHEKLKKRARGLMRFRLRAGEHFIMRMSGDFAPCVCAETLEYFSAGVECVPGGIKQETRNRWRARCLVCGTESIETSETVNRANIGRGIRPAGAVIVRRKVAV